MSLRVVNADQRFFTDLGWLKSHHSFNFGSHYHPDHAGHGLLVVANDDVVAPGEGFGEHGHRDMEIVSWVLEGSLGHTDSQGNKQLLHPGVIQRMSAGTGIRHAEMNGSDSEPVHFLQMWVLPDEVGIAPDYEELDVNERLVPGELVVVASGRPVDGAIGMHQVNAEMSVARLGSGDEVAVAAAPFVHVYVARGSVEIGVGDETATLVAGDAARLIDEGIGVTGIEPSSEIVVWRTGPAL